MSTMFLLWNPLELFFPPFPVLRAAQCQSVQKNCLNKHKKALTLICLFITQHQQQQHTHIHTHTQKSHDPPLS